MNQKDFEQLTRLIRESAFHVEEIVLDESTLPYDNRVRGHGEAVATTTERRKWWKRKVDGT